MLSDPGAAKLVTKACSCSAAANGPLVSNQRGAQHRVAMTAAKMVLEPIFEADFLPCSFGFRPKKSAHQALELTFRTSRHRYSPPLQDRVAWV
jgi:hypothetical protein